MKSKLIKKKCENCNKKFEHRDNKRNKNRKFCTGHCAKVSNGKSNKGRTHTPETIEKIRQSGLGDKNHFFGKKHSVDSKAQMSKSSEWGEEKFKYCNLTQKEKEILDGLMLGDGCMSEKSRISSRLTFGFKFKETVLDIFEAFPSFKFSPPWQNKKDKCWSSKSNMYSDLLQENRRWYLNDRKTVPLDVVLTSLSCYWWFIGDGYVSGGNTYLCTDSFTKKEINILILKLKKLNLNARITSRNRIRFLKKDSAEFMKWLEKNNIISKQYQYKWDNFKKQTLK